MYDKPRQSLKIHYLSDIAATLKEERQLLGLTQQQAAQQFGISLKALRNMEQGIDSVPLNTVIEILKYFGKEIRVGDVLISPNVRSFKKLRSEDVIETLKKVRPILEKKYGVKAMFLFGSYARDEATWKSDIDIIFEFESSLDFESLGRLQAFLDTIFYGKKVDIVDKAKILPRIIKTAKKDFIRV